MNTDGLFPLGEIDRHVFFHEFWRKKPLRISGAASRLLWMPSASRCREILNTLATIRPNQVRSGDRSIFGQNIDAVDPELRVAAARLSLELYCPNVWFDVVTTSGNNSGIGCHFDNSDNFTIQIEGEKRWKLHDPSPIPMEIQRQSLIRRDDLAHVDIAMPQDATELILRAGDILYIPMMWLHDGCAEGHSTSIVITCNSETPLSIVPYLFWVLIDRPEWTEPIPFPDLLTAKDESVVDRYFERLFEGLRNPSLAKVVKERWLHDRFSNG